MNGASFAFLGFVIPVTGSFDCITVKEEPQRLFRFEAAPLSTVSNPKVVSVGLAPPFDFVAIDSFPMNCETNEAGVICLTPQAATLGPEGSGESKRPHFLLLDSSSFKQDEKTAEGDFFFERNLSKERDHENVVCQFTDFAVSPASGQ